MSFYPQAFFPNPYAVAAAALSKPKQKPTKRACTAAGCTNGVVQGGLCVSHGAKRRPCQFPGCTKSSKTAGMCSKHGPRPNPCDEPGCTSISVRGTKCRTHAGPSKKCAVDGCRKGSVLGGVCKRHQDQVLCLPVNAAVSPNGITMAASSSLCVPMVQMPLSQAVAQQNNMMLASMYGSNPFIMYPAMTVMAPYAPTRGMDTLGSMYAAAASQRCMENQRLTTDALMMLELAKRSRERAGYDADGMKENFNRLPSSSP